MYVFWAPVGVFLKHKFIGVKYEHFKRKAQTGLQKKWFKLDESVFLY